MGKKQAVQAAVLLLEESDEADHPLEHLVALKPGGTILAQGVQDPKGVLGDHRFGRLSLAALVRELGAVHAARGLGAIQKAEEASNRRLPQGRVPQKLDRRFAGIVVKQPQAVVAGDEIVPGARPGQRRFDAGAKGGLLALTEPQVFLRRFARWRRRG